MDNFRHTACLQPIPVIKLQRGLPEAQNCYGFGMFPGHGLPDGNLPSLVLDGSPACKLFIALELERSPSERPCLMKPTFHSQMSTPDHPLHQITCFLVFRCSCNKHNCKRIGVKIPSGW